MEKNRELLEIYRRSTGQGQVAAAVAMGKNGILIGVPALIDVLELESAPLREMAYKFLREMTGQAIPFRADGAPAPRREAVERWREWWQANEAAIVKKTEAMLRERTVDSPEREKALKLWKEASAPLAAGKLANAENLLRQAAATDGTFFPAQLNLAVALYSQPGKTAEAIRLLEDLKSRQIGGVSFQDQGWIYLYLGHARRHSGELARAYEAYQQCLSRQPSNLQALVDAGEVAHELGAQGKDLRPEERKDWLRKAARCYRDALQLIEKAGDQLVALRAEDMPAAEALPFDRRAHNRSVLDVRRRMRQRRVELQFSLAKIEAMSGEKQAAMLTLNGAIGNAAQEEGEPWRKLQGQMRTYLGLLYEEAGEPLAALRQFRQVLQDLDPEQEDCKRGVERLRRKAAGGAEARE
jgi:tetratricopeptide (TPR) repeat protein